MGASTPPIIIEPFGANAGSSYIQLPIPVPSQLPSNPGRASFNDGFPSDTIGSGATSNPYGQDMNGILYTVTAYLQALTGGQMWPFSSTWAAANNGYAVGAIVSMAAGNGFWLNTVSGNTNNPDTTAAATSGWVPLLAYGTSAVTGLTNANVTLTAVQAATPALIFSGTLTGNVQIIFPPWIKRWAVYNNTSGAYSLTCKTASGNGVVIPQLGSVFPIPVSGDGTNLYIEGNQTGSFTATLSGPWASGDNPSGTLNYNIDGNTVTVWSPGNISASATTGSPISISGWPSLLMPSGYRAVPCAGLYNGGSTNICGALLLGSSLGTPELWTYASGSEGLALSNFIDNTGAAGIYEFWSVTYAL